MCQLPAYFAEDMLSSILRMHLRAPTRPATNLRAVVTWCLDHPEWVRPRCLLDSALALCGPQGLYAPLADLLDTDVRESAAPPTLPDARAIHLELCVSQIAGHLSDLTAAIESGFFPPALFGTLIMYSAPHRVMLHTALFPAVHRAAWRRRHTALAAFARRRRHLK